MAALRLVAVGKPLELHELPRPAPGSGEVLLRVRAAGICHSDAHYRAGTSPAGPLPLTPGHEVAGEVAELGTGVSGLAQGHRVCVHYQLACGDCHYCRRGTEQFCLHGRMLGRHADGGFAQYLTVPARNLFALPAGLSFEHGAVLMCSSATALHALLKARLAPGESVGVFGAGGLGLSAVQLARALGAIEVFALDRRPGKLATARELGAIAVDPAEAGALPRLDVAVDFTGSPEVMELALRSLKPFGRLAVVAITPHRLTVDTYRDLVGREAEIIGVSDHLASELPLLLSLGSRGALDLTRIVTRTVSLDAAEVNDVLDRLDRGEADARTAIVPA